MTIKRIHSGKRISRIVIHNGIVYLAGLQALSNRGGTVEEQTRGILSMIDRLLAEAGSDKYHLLTTTIWLSDIRTAEEMNLVWDDWLPADCAPARATVEGKPASSQHNVKIAVTATTIA